MIALYGLALFGSAALLFLAQPMVGKMALPILGGSPSVWNTCMVFFQGILLAGYTYAHLIARLLGARTQASLHVALFSAPLLLMMLPFALPAGAAPSSIDSPALWLLVRLSLFVGAPMFVISATSPLLQSWFASAGHPASHDPYFLYAASNAGSLIALIAYPLLIEPAFDSDQQGRIWAVGYVGLGILILACAVTLWKRGRNASCGLTAQREARSQDVPDSTASNTRVTLRRRIAWITLAMIPSSLVLGTTAQITINLSSAPLLWIAPLTLYLLSFSLTFARYPLLTHRWILRLLPFAAVPVAILAIRSPVLKMWDIPIHLLTLFLASMACHGELARLRPHPQHLTGFYLLISIGGVLGGLLNTIVAPLIFHSLSEYPLMLIVACLAAGGELPFAGKPMSRILDIALPVLASAFVLPLFRWAARPGIMLSHWQFELITLIVPTAICCVFIRRPARLALCIAGVLCATTVVSGSPHGRILYSSRNFFGIKSVSRVTSADGAVMHYFYHGTTTHGAQLREPLGSLAPLTYYHRKGPMGELFDAYAGYPARQHVAVVGLATGSLAAYGVSGGSFTFYEIDPEVKRIAEDPELFTYLSSCKAKYEVVLGDGRMMLERASDGQYGIIILDAFSSDAIPAHLLTLEAVRMYLEKLDAPGLLVMHITNTYVDLKGLLSRIAEVEGLAVLHRADFNIPPQGQTRLRFESEYVVLARTAEELEPLARLQGWQELKAEHDDPLWTDGFSNIWSVLKKP